MREGLKGINRMLTDKTNDQLKLNKLMDSFKDRIIEKWR